MNPFKELIKVAVAMAVTYGCFWLPIITLTIATTKLFYQGEPGLACGTAVGLVFPALYIGALTAHKVGTWFCLNWGKPYVDLGKDGVDRE